MSMLLSLVRTVRSGRLFRPLGAGVLALALLASAGASVASAQPEGGRQRGGPGMGGGPGGGFGGGMFGGFRDQGGRINSGQLKVYADILKMTPEQRSAAEALREGFQKDIEARDEAARKVRESAMEKFRENQDPAVWDEVRTKTDKARVERTKAEATFFEDIKTLLTSEQQAKWPKVERAHRRETTMSRGTLSGERVDLVHAVEALKLPDTEMGKVADLLEQYQDELDRELVRRNKVYDDVQTKMRDVFRDRDQEAGQKLMDEGRAASVRVRDLNRKFARQMEEALSEPQRAALSDFVKRESFPRVYRAPQIAREITAAAEFKDLDAAQKESLTALKDSFTRDLEGVNDKMATAQEREEMEFTVQRMMQRRFGGDNEEGPMADLRRQRRELEKAAADNLRKILRQDQVDRLPKAQPEDEGENNRGRRRDREGGMRRDPT